jgi:glyoxylase-like metal-dependent hydrolase (beta-lactamase superfamily II)
VPSVRAAETALEVIPLGAGLHMIQGSGGNVVSFNGRDGIVLIDTQYAKTAPLLAETVARLADNGPWRFVINTHFHGDHVGGNAYFAQKAPIIAHRAVRQFLAARDTQPQALPQLTFEDGLQLDINGETLQLQHYPPGHTNSDAIVWLHKNNVVHVGDLFFNGRFPFIDLDNGGDVRGYVANVEAILRVLPEDIVIVPGHGPKAARADYVRFRNLLVDSVSWAEAQIAAGRNAEAALEQPLPASWEGQSWEFISNERWVEILLRGLAPPAD